MFNNAIDHKSATPRPKIPGQFLAKNKWSPTARALLATSILEEQVELGPLCAKQVAQLCRVPLSLVYRTQRNTNGFRRRVTESLADHLARSSSAELQEAARTVGIQVIWDSMIQPVLDAEKAAAE